MKQFIANRTGTTPTLEEVPTEKEKVYTDLAAAEADIANIEESEFVDTLDDEVIKETDIATKNYVQNYAEPLPRPIDGFSSMTSITALGSFTQITLEEGFYCVRSSSSSGTSYGYIASSVSGTTVPIQSFYGNGQLGGFTVYLKAGDYYINGSNATLYKLGE